MKPLDVLIGCEYSRRVAKAFEARGHRALSVDFLEAEEDGAHYRGDLFDVIDYPWDIAIFFIDCTHLAVSGARHFKEKWNDGRQAKAAAQFMRLIRRSGHIPKVAIENPVGIMSSLYRKPDQIIQPWQYGHGETKATCLWLKGLPLLVPTNIVEGREPRIHMMTPSPDRWKERSRTYQGVADAMAAQWGATPEDKLLKNKVTPDDTQYDTPDDEVRNYANH